MPPTGTIAFLTLEELGDYVVDDDLAIAPLAELGFEVQSLPWTRTDIAWGDFDLIVVRSTWDYHRVPEVFLSSIARMQAAGARVENGLPLLRWNTDKRYLRELEQEGVPIVPTVWLEEGLTPGLLEREVRAVEARWGTGEVVLKPVIGASAEDTLRIPVAQVATHEAEALRLFPGRPAQLQPFLPSVVAEGEVSLIHVGGELSHLIRKVPAAGDFRVQEEYGGAITLESPTGELLEASARVMAALARVSGRLSPPASALYARVDLVRDPDGRWVLMELELVEPSLYLRMHPEAPGRFAQALVRRMAEGAPVR